MLEKYLGFLDLFKKPISLLLNKQQKVASDFGILISSAIIIFVLVQFSSNDIFSNANPKVVNQPLIEETRPLIPFKDRLMAFSIQDNEGNGLSNFDPSIFSIQIKNIYKTENLTIIKEYHLCTRNDQGFDNSSYDRLGLGIKNYFCLNNNSFDLEGYFFENRTTYFTIELIICDKTKETNCKNDQEINDYFRNNTLNLNLILSDLIVDSSNYETPLMPKYHVENILIDYLLKKQLFLYIKYVKLSSDDGKLFPNLGYYNGIAFDSKETDFISSNMDSNNLPIVQIKIFSAQLSLKVTRTYQKIPEVLANFIGLLGFLAFFGAFLSSLEKTLYITTYTMNYLYSFQNYRKDADSIKALVELEEKKEFVPLKINDNQLKNQDILEEKQMPPINTDNNKFLAKTNIKVNFEKKESNQPIQIQKELFDDKVPEEKKEKKKNELDILQEFKSFQDQKNKIELNLFEYIIFKIYNLFGCRKGLKRRLFWKAEELFANETDILNILKKLQDIEKLKIILLNPKQIALFNLLAKPMLYLEKEDYYEEKKKGGYKITEIIGLASKKENLKTALEFYQKNYKENEINKVDERLLLLLEQNIKDFKKLSEE